MGRASRNRQGPRPKERQVWWRTRRGRSYTLHPAEELAETRADAAAVPVRTGAGAAALYAFFLKFLGIPKFLPRIPNFLPKHLAGRYYELRAISGG